MRASLCKKRGAQLFSPLYNFIAASTGEEVVDEKAARVIALSNLEVRMRGRKWRLCKINNVILYCNRRNGQMFGSSGKYKTDPINQPKTGQDP